MKSLLTAGLLLTLALMLSPSAFAQTSTNTKATVYIYKNWHLATVGRTVFKVYMNDKEIVRLDRHIYCIAKLDPGQYRFRTKYKAAPRILLEAKAGETYYLRLATENGGWTVKDPIISRELSDEDAKKELTFMEPVKPGDVKDKSTVLVNYPDHPAGQKRKKPSKDE